MNGSYVDDLIRAGNYKFKDICNITHEKIETTPDESPPFSFADLELMQLPDDSDTLGQSFYLEKIKVLSNDDLCNTFASRRTILAWLVSSRPDICVDISQIASLTKDKINENT